MAVEVYIWFPDPPNIGHAAMKVTGGSPMGDMYLSHWPGSLAAALAFGSGVNNRYNDDVSAEGGDPSVVRITGLDETAIKAKVKSLIEHNLYSFWALNCATGVSIALDAGVSTLASLAANAVDIGLPAGTNRNTPWGLYAYARTLAAIS
jgi:hypothetical protein